MTTYSRRHAFDTHRLTTIPPPTPPSMDRVEYLTNSEHLTPLYSPPKESEKALEAPMKNLLIKRSLR